MHGKVKGHFDKSPSFNDGSGVVTKTGQELSPMKLNEEYFLCETFFDRMNIY